MTRSAATPNLLQAAPPDILFAFPKRQFAVPWMEGGGGGEAEVALQCCQ